MGLFSKRREVRTSGGSHGGTILGDRNGKVVGGGGKSGIENSSVSSGALPAKKEKRSLLGKGTQTQYSSKENSAEVDTQASRKERKRPRRRFGNVYRQSANLKMSEKRKSSTISYLPAGPDQTAPGPAEVKHVPAPASELSEADALHVAVQERDIHKINKLCFDIAHHSAIGNRSLRDCVLQESMASALLEIVQDVAICYQTKGNAAYILSEMAIPRGNVKILAQLGTVKILLSVCRKSGNYSRVVYMAIRGIRNMLAELGEFTEDSETESWCVTTLASVLKKEQEIVQVYQEAAGAVANITEHGGRFQAKVVKAGILKMMVTLALSPGTNVETLQQITISIANISADISSKNQTGKWTWNIINDGGLQLAIDLIGSSKDPDVLSESARILANLAVSPSGRRAIADLDGLDLIIKHYVKDVNKNNLTTLTEFARAIGNMCIGDAATSSRIYNEFGRKSMLEFVLTDIAIPEALRHCCREALINMIQSNVKLRSHLIEHLTRMNHQFNQSHHQKRVQGPNTRLLDFRQEIQLRSHDYRDEISAEDGMDGFTRASQKIGTGGEAEFGKKRYLSIISSSNAADAMPRGSYVQDHTPGFELSSEELADKAWFEVGEVIGKGGYGTVFKARDMRSEVPKFVAIKQVRKDRPSQDDGHRDNGAKESGPGNSKSNRRALREMKVWRGLDHDNVVKYLACFEGDQGDLNLVAEYIDGPNLSEMILRWQFPESVVAEIVLQILNGLEYIHSKGVIHRDLKPANILVERKIGRIKLADFGVSWSSGLGGMSGGKTVVGTPSYISPEMLNLGTDRPKASSKLDIWALGSCVAELVSGKRPYHDLSGMEVLLRILKDRHPPIPESISAECKGFIELCWKWEPEDRPSATELKRHPFIEKRRESSGTSKATTSNFADPSPQNLALV